MGGRQDNLERIAGAEPTVTTPGCAAHVGRSFPAPTLSVLVPIYNEARTLGGVIAAMDAADTCGAAREFVFIDDASTDGSLQILTNTLRDRSDAVVLRHSTNRGKGAAIRTGLAAARGDLILIQDADQEYDPGDWPSVLGPLLRGEADVVFGSRFRGSSQGWYVAHWCANRILSLHASVVYGRWITDVYTCYKAFRRRDLATAALREDGFGVDIELAARLSRARLRYREVPISYRGRTFSQGKKLRWRDGLMATWAVLKYRFCR